jgi:hypothetical protein
MKGRRDMAEILPNRRKTPINQSINQSMKGKLDLDTIFNAVI